MPPSFPSHLRTSTPPPLLTIRSAHSQLTKPPEIPRNENLCFPASLPSPLPFPLSQTIDGNQGSNSHPNGSPSLSRKERLLPDASSPARSPSRLSEGQHQFSFSNKPESSRLPLNESHDDVRRRDRHISSTPSPPEHVPVIDLRQLMSPQRPREKLRHLSHGILVTPRTKDKGKSRAMTVDISPSQLKLLSPPRTSRSLARVSSPDLRTPPLSPTNFNQDADAFAPVAASTQPPLAKGLPRVDSGVFAFSQNSQPLKAYGLPVNDALVRADFAAWMVDMPVLEESRENDSIPEQESHALAEMMPPDEHV